MAYAYDFSIVPGPAPETITANAGAGILHYGTGNQQPADYLAAVDAAGLKRAWIWEHNTDSILAGFDSGVAECQAWEASHPPGLVYLACDLNDGALGGNSVIPFCSGWRSVTREPVTGLYGPDHAWAQVRGVVAGMDRMWGVVNWLDGGGPDNDPANIARWTQLGASIIQLIGSPIDGTDQNLVLKDDWWTTGATPAPTNPYLEDDMASPTFFATDPADRRMIWEFPEGGGRVHVGPERWGDIQLDRAFKGLEPLKPLAGTPALFVEVPDVTNRAVGGTSVPTKVTSTVTSVIS